MIKTHLQAYFQDFVLSPEEKAQLREHAVTLLGDFSELNSVRNYAFEMVTVHMRNHTVYHAESLKWLEQVIKTLDAVKAAQQGGPIQVFFSPSEACLQHIISQIKQAKRSIDVCVFTISDNQISDELVRAHQRGVAVRVVTDNDKLYDSGSDIAALAQAGIPVKVDKTPNHMHHKFAIFDDTRLLNGSFNWTRSASLHNHENLMYITDMGAVRSFLKVFNLLWAEFPFYEA